MYPRYIGLVDVVCPDVSLPRHLKKWEQVCHSWAHMSPDEWCVLVGYDTVTRWSQITSSISCACSMVFYRYNTTPHHPYFYRYIYVCCVRNTGLGCVLHGSCQVRMVWYGTMYGMIPCHLHTKVWPITIIMIVRTSLQQDFGYRVGTIVPMVHCRDHIVHLAYIVHSHIRTLAVFLLLAIKSIQIQKAFG